LIYVLHRINELEQLKKIPSKYGVEIDIRSEGNNLIIHHDPFKKGVLFKEWLKIYNHKLLIINIKEEGLEPFIISELNKYKIKNFFFLDQSFPFIIKKSKLLSKKSAVRFSEFENIKTVLAVHKYVKWVWIDCFNYIPINKYIIEKLKENNFKICLVSPELQGRNQFKEIFFTIKKLKKIGFKPDAICTKNISIWESVFKNIW
tara:strand:- start:159 stop:767 length:609 start_codon:yes stop_codon:yes gene_type:complete